MTNLGLLLMALFNRTNPARREQVRYMSGVASYLSLHLAWRLQRLIAVGLLPRLLVNKQQAQ